MSELHREDSERSLAGTSPLRVGGVVYLNARPLIWALPALCPWARISFDVPSRLASQLAAEELDVAIVPAIEAFRSPDYVVLSDACIAAADFARSVVIFSRVPLDQIKTLALDAASRTSAAVSRILLAEKYGVFPEVRELRLGDDPASLDCDAVLMIGDRAMTVKKPPLPYAHDLAAEWCSWTGLPLVFAVWVARPADRDWTEIARIFAAARDRGLAVLDIIARKAAEELGLPHTLCYEYLTRNLHFTMGPKEHESLDLFGRLAAKYGFVPANGRLRVIR
ncbi:MAG: menaquinone biosynthesis protein [Thermogutta sp.]|uniref:menaquinone biosynthetic enzyme MqnA/MqnD family protein n=1 Tax=Thermogutta sp. TaxID=1962930 RepID=UPI0019876832|nr:menaquinone biosynthesis protein [Thermogutta sp.]MBC7353157.1 menaquinone biosynthesis protein [Thermogutta sp.]